MKTDLFARDWGLGGVINQPIAEVQERFLVPDIDPAMPPRLLIRPHPRPDQFRRPFDFLVPTPAGRMVRTWDVCFHCQESTIVARSLRLGRMAARAGAIGVHGL